MYKLNEKQFEYALNVLKREQQNHMPSEWQRKCYVLFKWAFITLLLIAATTVIPLYLGNLFWIGILGIILIICCLIVVVLFFLNIPFYKKLFHLQVRVKRLGLKHYFNSKSTREQRRRLNKDVALLFGSLLWLVVFIYFILFIILEMRGDSSIAFIGSLATLILLTLGLSPAFIYMLNRHKRLLKLEELESEFIQLKEESAEQFIEVPIKYYNKIAGIERQQIDRSRTDIVAKGLWEKDAVKYSIQKSTQVKAQLHALKPEERWAAEDRIDELTMEPRPSEVIEDANMDVYWLPFKDGGVYIGYNIEESKQRIRILSLRPITDIELTRKSS